MTNIKEESEIEDKSDILNFLKIRKKMNKKKKIAKNSKTIKLLIPKIFKPRVWKITEPIGIIIRPFSFVSEEKVLLKSRLTIELT